jgi:phage baseplate assembly protein W
MNVAFPLRLDGRGHIAATDDDDHIRDMIEQVLFTTPGERVMRPSFGSGLLQLVFAPNSSELAATVQYLAESSLQQWLGDLIEVKNLAVTVDDSTLRVDLEYIVRRTQQTRSAQLSRSVPR